MAGCEWGVWGRPRAVGRVVCMVQAPRGIVRAPIGVPPKGLCLLRGRQSACTELGQVGQIGQGGSRSPLDLWAGGWLLTQIERAPLSAPLYQKRGRGA